MSECLLFIQSFTVIGRWRWRGRGGGVGRGTYTGMCRRQGIVFDLSVLNWVYNFVRVCQQGIACTTGFICWINFVQYKGNDYNVDLL